MIAGVKMTTEDVMRRLRGKRGTEVTVKVMRRGVKELLPFTIKRDKIPVYSLDASYMVDKKIGYIRVNRLPQLQERNLLMLFIVCRRKVCATLFSICKEMVEDI